MLSAACGSTLKGNGEVVTETQSVSAFDSLDVDNGAEVFIAVDPTVNGDVDLAVTAESNLIEFLKTEVRDSELQVSPDRDGGMRSSRGFEVSGTVAALDRVTVDNGAEVTVTGPVDDVTLEVDNGGRIDAEGLEATSASINADNGAQIIVCAVGKLTGDVTNGAELTVRCAGDTRAMNTSDGGRIISAP